MCRRGCLCGSLQWLAALALNGAVVGSLAFCLFRLQNWPVSLAGSVVYLLFLVGMTRRTHALEISRAEPPPEEPTSDDAGADDVVTGLEGTSEEPPETSSAQVGSSNRRRALPTISLGLSLWYLLTILVLAVPGAILVFCVFPCSHWNGQLVERYWKTNTSSFSEEVIQWMENPTLQNADSFCQVGETVYVYGSFENAASDLYAIQNGAVPQGLGYSGAHNLAAVSDATVCFIQDDPSLYDGAMMFCGSAAKGFRTVPKDPRTYVFSLQGIGGLLWFRQVRDDFLVISSMGYPCGSYSMRYGESPDDLCPPADTIEVLSLNVTTMDITGHSVKYASPHEPQQRESVSYDDVSYDDGDFLEDNDDEEQDDGGVEEDDAIIEERKELFCVDGMWTRWRALGGAVLSALPVIISSVRIWIKHAIPSAPIALFFGIGMGFACFSGFFDPWPALEGFFIWTTFGTPIWAIVCTYQLIVNPKGTSITEHLRPPSFCRLTLRLSRPASVQGAPLVEPLCDFDDGFGFCDAARVCRIDVQRTKRRSYVVYRRPTDSPTNPGHCHPYSFEIHLLTFCSWVHPASQHDCFE